MGPARTSSRQRLLSSCCRGQVGQVLVDMQQRSALPCPPPHSGPGSGTACACVRLCLLCLRRTRLPCSAHHDDRASRAADAGGSAAGPAQLFIYISSSACFWYNTNLARSAHLEEQYWLAGWLLGQMLHNRTSFPLATSPVVTEKLILGSQFEVSSIMMS